ncbi:MAG: hypothetical protein R3223_02560 [Longimicrobiales bacterium]|nr:hypothetical protein [Longimicrobiales bacterium]
MGFDNGHSQAPRRRTPLLFTTLALAATLAACSDGDPFGPDPASLGAFSRTVEFSAVVDEAATAPVRLEVEILDGGPPWTAREVEMERDEDLTDDEKIESRIVEADEGAGTLTLAVGNLLIDLSEATRFRSEGSEGDGDLTRSEFYSRVETLLADGQTPGVELRRPAPESPQAPDETSFLPTDVRLDDEADDSEIEMNVDDRHLSLSGSDEGTITLLGLEIQVTPDTEVEAEEEAAEGAFEIESLVTAVDVDAGEVTLHGGDILRIVDGTRFEGHDDEADEDDDEELTSLAAVQAALDQNRLVEVEAEVVQEAPGVFVAIEVEFEVEDGDDDVPGSVEFEGDVTSVDVEAGTFVVGGILDLSLVGYSSIDDDSDYATLQAVSDALDAGSTVSADGHAISDESAPTGSAVLEVEFESESSD